MTKSLILSLVTVFLMSCGGANNDSIPNNNDVPNRDSTAYREEVGHSGTSKDKLAHDDNSKDNSKNLCSSEFISAYEKVRFRAHMMQTFATEENWQELKSLCPQLFAKYGHIQCVASVTKPGQLEGTQETVSVDNLKSVCEEASKH